MPHRKLLSPAQRTQIWKLPTQLGQIQRLYTLSSADLEQIRKHRKASNRLGFAVQLCLLRYPGRAWTPEEVIPESMLRFIASQVRSIPEKLNDYARRDETRREHLSELQQSYGWVALTRGTYRELSLWLGTEAHATDQGMTLMKTLMGEMRRRKIIIPDLTVLERLTLSARARARRESYRHLTVDLSDEQKSQIQGLLERRPDSRLTYLGWLRFPLGTPSPKNILSGIEKLNYLKEFEIPTEWATRIHQNRLIQIAREGAATDVTHLRSFGDERKYATLVGVVLDTRATLIDDTLEMHERYLARKFRQAERRHLETFQEQGKAINNKVRLFTEIGNSLIRAREAGDDPYAELEKVISWEAFKASVQEAESLARPEEFDYLDLITRFYPQLRRYAPEFLVAFEFRSTPASEELIQAVELLLEMNRTNARRVPKDAPRGFVPSRWAKHVFQDDEVDRRFYETCVFAEIGKSLRAGDLWVSGSRRHKDFEEFLLPKSAYIEKKRDGLDLSISDNCEKYLSERSNLLHEKILQVQNLAKEEALPDATILDGVIKISPLENQEPEEAELLARQAYGILPRIRVTDLLMEVDEWTQFTQHFTHLRGGDIARDKTLLLTAILSDGINLGLTRMAEACPGLSISKLSRVAAMHIREETYGKALSEIVNHHHSLSFSGHWGEGTTSSSDGQHFPTGGRGEARGAVNARYGNEPGVTFYTHISDQYSPFHSKLINSTIRDATHVLDGLLYHESDLRIQEHYTDTAGFTDHVFAICHLLGYRFAPRIRHLANTKLYAPEVPSTYQSLDKMIARKLNKNLIETHWDEILRLALSIKQGTVTASLMLHKLGSYPRQNGLATALREFGRLERSIFLLEYICDLELRRRIHTGLNKGEARNAMARAVFFNRLGELRDRTYENQKHRASGLNLVVAAIVLWNTVYLEKAVEALRASGWNIPDTLLQHLSPLKWEHITLTGDYRWRTDAGRRLGRFRPLRPVPQSIMLSA